MVGVSLMATVLFWHGFDKLVSCLCGGGYKIAGNGDVFFKTRG